MASGFVLHIDDSMLEKLDKADEKIKQLAKTSDATSKAVNDAFRAMAGEDSGIQAFIKKLGVANSALANFANGRIATNGLNVVSNASKQAGDSVVSLANNLTKVGEAVTKNESVEASVALKTKSRIDEENKAYKEQQSLYESLWGITSKKNLDSVVTSNKINDSIKKWELLKKKVVEYQASIEKLEKRTARYEAMVKKNTKNGVANVRIDDKHQYERDLKRIEVLKKEMEVLQNQQNEIDKSNQQLAKQLNIRENLKNSASASQISEMRQSANLQKLNENFRAGNSELQKKFRYEDELAKKAEEVIRIKKREREEAEKGIERQKRVQAQAADEAIKQAEKVAKAQAKAHEKNAKMYEDIFGKGKVNYASYGGAMNFSKTTSSIKEETAAIKLLENARDNLSKTDKDYNKKLENLNNEIKRHNKNINEAKKGSKNLVGEHSHLMDISGQLARKLALVFSVSQIQGYINKMVQVRGEFELQQRALQAIVQNKVEANKLWGQVVNLAVQSPFRVKELVTYTKQLAAYRVESDKLFKTTKMLADVSAGLGVDMNRLILAFGQVKAANYLRGTELRQFSEAGINVLQELANQFSEVEGRAVSVGEVFDRVSKRMVSFEDVEKVFQRITSDGGMFYRMQEIQSETVKGQISNLKDSIDVMLNEIGAANDGVLKKVIKAVRIIVENLSEIAPLLKITALGFTFYQLSVFRTRDSVLKFVMAQNTASLAMKQAVPWTKLLSAGLKSVGRAFSNLGKIISNNWIVLAILAIGTAIVETWSIFKETKGALLAVTNEINEQIIAIDKLDRAYAKIIEKQKKLDKKGGGGEETFDEKKDALKKLVEYAEGINITIPVNFEEVDSEEIDAIFQNAIKNLKLSTDFKKDIASALARRGMGVEGWFHVFGDNIKTDLNELNESINEFAISLGAKMQPLVNEYEAMRGRMSRAEERWLDELNRAQKENESSWDYYVNKYIMLESLVKRFGVLNRELWKDVKKRHSDLMSQTNEARHELDKIIGDISDWNIAGRSNEDKFTILATIRTVFEENNYSEDTVNSIVEYFRRKLQIGIPIKITPPEDDYEEWIDRYNEYIKREIGEEERAGKRVLASDFVREIKDKKNANRTKLTEELEGYLKLQKDILDKVEAGSQAFNKAEIKEAKEEVESLTIALEWLRGKEEDTKGSPKLKWIRDRIDLIEKLHKEYLKLNKTFDETKSKEDVIDGYTKAFNELFQSLGMKIGDVEFVTEKDVEDSLKLLIPWAKKYGKEATDLLNEAIAGHTVSIEIDTQMDKNKQVLDEIQDLFDNYSLSLDLSKLNIPKNLAKEFFGIDMMDVDELRSAVESYREQVVGTDMEEEYERFLEKVDNMVHKSYVDRMKDYVKILGEGQMKAVAIKLEEIQKIKKLEEMNEKEMNPEKKEIIKQRIQQSTKKAIQSEQWNEFKNTDLYTMIFGDLDNLSEKALDAVMNKLNELKTSLSELDASELKVITDQIQKITDELSNRRPFQMLKELRAELKELAPRDETFSKIIDNQAQIDALQKELNVIDEVHTAFAQGNFDNVDAETLSVYNKILESQENTGKEIDEIRKSKQDNINTLKSENGELQEQIDKYDRVNSLLKGQIDKLNEINSKVSDIFSATSELLESIGVSGDSVAMIIMQSIQSMVSLTISAIVFGKQLEIIGVQANLALSVIGWIAISIQAIATLMSAVFKSRDKTIEKQVVENKRKVEELTKAYEKLQKAIDEAFDYSQVDNLNKKAERNLKESIEAQQKAIDAQKRRKGANKEGSEANKELRIMQEELDELYEKQEEWAQNLRNKTISIFEDLASASDDFVDAWYDAFKETGDGMDGLEEHFEELLVNMLKRQASLKIAGKFIGQWDKVLDKYFDNDSNFSREEIIKFAERVRSDFPELNQALKDFFENFGLTLGNAKGELSGLQKGIQGITEDTAQILAAYLNSVRFFVADSNSKLGSILDYLRNNDDDIANPVLGELKAQTSILSKIYSFMSRDMVGVAPTGGQAFKVMIK